jgi:hypothetical protein
VFNATTQDRLRKPTCLRFNLHNEQNKEGNRHPCISSAAEFRAATISKVLVITIDPYPASAGEGMQKVVASPRPKTALRSAATIPFPMVRQLLSG